MFSQVVVTFAYLIFPQNLGELLKFESLPRPHAQIHIHREYYMVAFFGNMKFISSVEQDIHQKKI